LNKKPPTQFSPTSPIGPVDLDLVLDGQEQQS